MGIKDLSDFVLPVQKLKEGEETKKVQQCRKIQSNFVTYHGFYPHKKGGSLPVEADLVPPFCIDTGVGGFNFNLVAKSLPIVR